MPVPDFTTDDVEFLAMRAQGAGGQHVNKTESAVQLRFDIAESRLPEGVKARLLALSDHRIQNGMVLIKAQEYRSQERNKEAALARLAQLVASVWLPPKKRKKTKPSFASRQKRLKSKAERGALKSRRREKFSRDD